MRIVVCEITLKHPNIINQIYIFMCNRIQPNNVINLIFFGSSIPSILGYFKSVCATDVSIFIGVLNPLNISVHFISSFIPNFNQQTSREKKTETEIWLFLCLSICQRCANKMVFKMLTSLIINM